MSGRRRILAVCALAGLSVACSASSRHGVLTFFFDGVPTLEAPGAVEPAKGGASAPKGVVRVREHGPYAAKLCDGCHERSRGNALVLPPDRLCGRCHVLPLGKEYVHGPLNGGGCSLCHDPHRSPNAFLLTSDSGAFCLSCHERGSLRVVDGHDRLDAACTTCHEAHMSDRKYLLR